MNGYNIIIDQNSGCVHSVDDVAYDIITNYENKNKDEIKSYILEKYKDRDDVTAEDIDLCFDDIETLKKEANCLPKIHLKKRLLPLKKDRAY